MLDQYNDILTIDDVCEALMIGRNRCYHLLADGDIRGFRIGSVWKIPKEAIIAYIHENIATRSNIDAKKISPGT